MRIATANAPPGLHARIWSTTTNSPSCLPFRARCFVLKAQYVKNVLVPGEGFEPSCSSLWARRIHQFRQPGIPSGDPCASRSGCHPGGPSGGSPVQGSPSRIVGTKSSEPGLVWTGFAAEDVGSPHDMEHRSWSASNCFRSCCFGWALPLRMPLTHITPPRRR